MPSITEELIKNSEKRNSAVNHPRHYNGKCSVECIDAMEIAFSREAVICFCKCNAFKYLWRYRDKGGKVDLEKALWYCDRANTMLNEDEGDAQIDSLVRKIQEHIDNVVEEVKPEGAG